MKESRLASISRFRDPLVLSFQAVVIAVSLIAAFWIRLDFSLSREEWSLLNSALIVVIPVKMIAFILGGLRKDSWRYATLSDLARIGVVNTGASVLSWAAV